MTMRVFAVDGKTDSTQDYRLTAGAVWTPASALNARTGVTTVPTLTGTGALTANISAFTAVIDGTSNALQGCYAVTNDTAAGVTVNAGSAQSRIDLIGIQVQDNTWDGSGQHQAIPVYVAGTPGSGAAPATPANTIPLFNVAVPASASSVNFATATTSVFPYTAAAGGIIPVRSSADKPAAANGVAFRYRLDVTPTPTGPSPLESSTDGVTYTPISNFDGALGTWNNLSVNTSFDNIFQPQYRTAPGGKIELRGAVRANATLVTGSTVLTGTPVPANNKLMPMPCIGASGYLLATTSGVLQFVSSASLVSGNYIGLDGLSYTL